MSKFITDLDPRLKTGSDKIWIIQSPLVYESDLVGVVRVPVGFETDLASVPRVPIIYAMWGARAHREAVLHDYLFRINASPAVTFDTANEVLLEAMKATGKPWYIRYPMYWGVCFGAHEYFNKHRVEDVL